MKLHAVCFSIRVVPFSTKPESHIVTLPTEGFEKPEEAWGFLKMALAEFLPKTLELEETMTLYEEEVGDQGFFFSGSDAASDDHYHVILKYAFF